MLPVFHGVVALLASVIPPADVPAAARPPPIFGPPATDVLRSAAAEPRPLVLRPAFQEPKARCRPRPKTSLSALMFRPLTKNRAAAALTPGTTNDFTTYTTSLARSFFFHLILCVRARPLRPLNFQPQKFSHVTKRVTAGPLRVFFREKKLI